MGRPKAGERTKQIRVYESDHAALKQLAEDRRRTTAELFRSLCGSRLREAAAAGRKKRAA
jgi:hypothetical protein